MSLTVVALLLAGVLPIGGPRGIQAATVSAPGMFDDVDSALRFEPNVGQTDPSVDYSARGPGYSVFLSDGDAVLSLGGDEGRFAVRMELDGAAESPAAVPMDERLGIVNYLIGNDPSNWRTGIPTFGAVEYHGVYPGVDIRYHGNDRQLRYDFIVQPDADPGAVALRFEGATSLNVADDGSLEIGLNPGRSLVFSAPVTYQDIDGQRVIVDSAYVLTDDRVTFALGDYDSNLPLVIDPTLDYGTYLGSNQTDDGFDVAVDDAGNAYIVGAVGSASTTFPTTPGAFDTTSEAQEAFVTKLSADGSTLVYSTYLGGQFADRALGVAVNGAGEAYVVGSTGSDDFPLMNPYDNSRGAAVDGFVSKLNATGTGLVYSTYLGGGTWNESVNDVAIDAAGSAYVTGYTDATDFPLVNAFDSSFGTANAPFVTKFTPDGTGLVYSSYLSGSDGSGDGRGIDVDASGNAYVTGQTRSSDFPTTASAYDQVGSGVGEMDAYVTKIDPTGSSILYSTYISGTGNDLGTRIQVAGGDAYVTGYTGAIDFPVTAGAFDTTKTATDLDGFVLRIDPTQTGAASLVFSTFLGGDGAEWANDLVVGASKVYVAGETDSDPPSFPVTGDAHQGTRAGGNDAFVASLSLDGSTLGYLSYVGGALDDRAKAIDIDADENIYLAGYTSSTDFDVTVGAYDENNSGGRDAFVVKFAAMSLVVNSTGNLGDNDTADDVCNTGGTVGADPECTLRAAIEQANATAGTDTISFAIPTSDGNYQASPLRFRIPVSTFMTPITDPVVIDGTTQPEFATAGRPVIVLDGTGMTAPEPNGITLQAGSSTIRGLVIQNFGDDGIEIEIAGGNTIVGNYIGTDVTGMLDQGNGWGVAVKSNGNTIGGATADDRNVISGNSNYGLSIYNAASGNVVSGNYVGVASNGTTPRGNGTEGVWINAGASSNTVGGTTAQHGNVISGNGSNDAGILVTGATTSANIIQFNQVGTNAAGTAAVPNSLHGIRIDNAPDTQILDNLVSGNAVHGIYVFDTGLTGTQILRNTIGTNLAQTAAVPNVFDGIRLEGGSADTTIGSPGNGNVISGNTQDGITINDNTGTIVQGNYIGTDSTATQVLGNGGDGIFNEVFGSSNNLIGGDGAGEGNTIAHNDDGIELASGTGNSVLGNDIHSNTGLGIDLVGGTEDPSGVTDNDAGDADSGPNDLLNFPLITSAVESGGTVDVTFDLDVPANPDQYRVEFFTNPSGADGSGHGEGESFVSAVTTSPGTGLTHSFGGSVGDVITATATRIDSGAAAGYSSTSEFSAAATVRPMLLGRWRLDEGSGSTAFDDSGAGHDGAITGASYTTGVLSTGLDFTGSAGERVVVGDPVDGSLDARTGDLSISAWFRTTVVPGSGEFDQLVYKSDGSEGYELFLADDGGTTRLTFRVRDGGSSWTALHTTPLDDGVWHHAAAVMDGSNLHLYLDGTLVDTQPHSAVDIDTTELLAFGADSAGPAWSDFEGELDEIAIYGAALSTTEVEDLAAASSLFVNSTGDAGDDIVGDGVCATTGTVGSDPECTLRAAIQEANASANGSIRFDIPIGDAGHTGGVWTITLGSVLPALTTADLVVDASTQPGYSTTPVVEIDGTSAGAGGDGFRLQATGVTIRGFAINRFPGDGIEVPAAGSGAVIEANHLGLDASGLIDRGNGGHGVDLQTGSTGSTVGGTTAADRNVISGNGLEGIVVDNSSTNTIIGNYIGTDVTGNAAILNTNDGIHVANGSDDNIFGQAGAGNVISGNGNDALEIDDVSSGNVIQANIIGLGADGSTVVANTRYGVVLYNGANTTQIGGSGAGEGNVVSGNGSHGIVIDGNSNALTTGNVIAGNLVGTDTTGLVDKGNTGAGIYFFGGTPGNTVGGATAGHRNVISGNGTDGVYLQNAGTTGTVIQGNYIGVDATGNAPLPNSDRGVQIESGANNTIVGGSAAGEGNVISANGNDGIIISDGASPGTGTTGTIIEGNKIGVGADGTTALGNGTNGVRVTTEDGHRIGGTAAGAGNTIAHNAGRGVDIQNASANANPILRNSIFSNTNIGIDLGDDGVTVNDSGDGDTGANDLLNFPVITSASESAGTVTADFDLDAPAGTYRVEFFDSGVADGSGYGEGETFVHATTVVHAGAGSESFSTTFSGTTGDIVTTTATADLGGGSFGSTSEFSVAYTVTSEPTATVTFQQGTDGYSGTVDTWVSDAVPNQDNSAALSIDTDTSPVEQGLIRFDNIIGSGPGQVPPGATITSATLTVVNDNPAGSGASLSLYRMLTSWAETDTWNILGSGVQTDDVEASSTADVVYSGAELSVADSVTTITGLEASVQAWADGTSNDGWLLLLSGTTDGLDLRSSENATVAWRPLLTVSYSTVQAPPVANDDAVDAVKDIATVIDVLANDTDPNNDPLTIQSVTQGTNGTVVNNGTDVTYTPDPAWTGVDTFTYTINDGNGGTDTATVTVTVTEAFPSLWLSTLADVPSPSDAPGLDSWTAGSLLEFADPGFALEPPATAGTFSLITDLNAQGDGNVVLTGLDLVESAITIGGSPSVALQEGDLLLSTENDEAFTNWDTSTTATKAEDVVLFRPQTPGDYSSGTFSVLLAAALGNVADFSLVEQATTVGDTLLPAGSFLLTDADIIYRLDPTAAGPAVSPGVPTLLVDGPDVAINQNIVGLHVVESAVQADGVDFFAGDLLVSIDNTDAAVGDNGVSVVRQDVFQLRLTATTAGSGAAAGDAALVFDGSDVGLDTNDEDVRGVILLGGTPISAPIAVNDSVVGMKNGPLVVAPLVNDADPNGDPLSIQSFTQPADGTVTDNGDGTVTYTPDFGFTGGDAFTYTVSDGSETDTGTVTVDVRTPELRIATVDDVVASGTLGITSWTTSDLLSVGDPSFTLDPPTTSGTVGAALDLGAFSADGVVRITAAHQVTTPVTIGSGLFSFDLEPGDLVLATTDTETLAGTTTSILVANKDVFVYRPTSPGAPQAGGEFYFLLDDPTGGSINGVAVVERDTIVGDTVLVAGTLLLAHSGGSKAVHTYEATSTGELTTTGSLELLADLAEIGLGGAVDALVLVEREITSGGRVLAEGTILASTDGETTVAGLPVERFDVFGLALTQTTLVGGTTVGTSSMVFDGSDASFDDNTENPTAFSLFAVPDQSAGNATPVAVDDAASTGPAQSVVIDVVANDTDADAGDVLTVEAVTDGANGTVVDNGDGTVTYTRDALFVGTDTFGYRINDGNGATDTAIVTVTADPPTGALAVWRTDGSTIPQYSRWDGTAFGPTQASANVGEWRTLQAAEAPTRDEAIAVGVDTAGVIRGERWNGSTWSALPFNPMATVTESFWQGLDVAYESLSGDAVVVWNNGTTGTAGITYREWDGSTWSSAQTITTPLSGEPKNLRLVPDPRSDSMILMASNSSSQDYALVWDGTTWVNSVVLSSSGTGDALTDVYAAWQTETGEAIAVYGKGATSVFTRTWDGSSWSSESTITPPAGSSGTVRWTVMASDTGSDRIGLGVLTDANSIWLAVHDGTSWGSTQLATTTSNSTISQNVSLGFETDTGDLLAVYGTGVNDITYRVLPNGGSWSAEQIGADVGSGQNTMMLYPDPNGDRMMLAAHLDNSDLDYVLWDGSAWGLPYEPTANTGEVKNQPFDFAWDANPGVPRPTYEISGVVFEDVAGDVLADGVIGDANNPGVVTADVYVYLDDGDGTLGAGDALVGGAPTQTDAFGSYVFAGLDDGDYFVVVDSKSLTPAGAVGTTSNTWAEQTYGPIGGYCDTGVGFQVRATAGPCYGGISDSISDDFSQWDDREHRALVTIAAADVGSIDFGFSYNVVTTLNGGDTRDDDAVNGRTVQGSLRQFIQNANEISGANAMRFVPATSAGAGGVWTVPVTNALPASIDAQTSLLGAAHDPTDGVSVLDTNPLGPELELAGSAGIGLDIQGGSSVVRGLVINGFATGVQLTGGGSNTVAGNYIGPDATGQIGGVGNTTEGIRVYESAGNVVGGSSVADRNVISGNRLRGIAVDDYFDGAPITSSGTQIVGNHIGTTADGAAALPYDGAPSYQQIGVYLLNADNATVGTAAAGNVISGNDWFGIYSWGPDGDSSTFQGNIVGLDATATASVGNGADDPATRAGMYFSNSPGNLIGGIGLGEGNIIAGNDAKGLVLNGSSAVDNAVLGNAVSDNAGIGIDLVGGNEDPSGVTDNDPGDGDTGPNELLNFAEVVHVQRVAGALVVDLSLDAPAGDYRIELFGNTAADPSGHGEGEIVLGGDTVTHTGSGAETFRLTVMSGPTILSATATEDLGGGSFGSTSEFSLAVPSPDLVIVNSTGDGADAVGGDGQCDTSGSNADGDPECTLRAAIEEANDPTTPIDTIWFDIPSADTGHSGGVWTITPATALPAITSTVSIDGTTQPGTVVNTAAAPLPLNGSPTISIDGGGTVSGDGLLVQADSTEVRGLVIGGFIGAGSYAIDVAADNVTIAGNYVGTDRTGSTSNSSTSGIGVNGTGTVIGGTAAADRNLIAGDHAAQIRLDAGPNTQILGNVIGANAAIDAVVGTVGAAVQAAVGDGVAIGSATAPNVIVAPAGEYGIELGGATATIDSNLIGTESTYAHDLGGQQGILVGGGGTTTVTDNVVGNWDQAIRITAPNVVVTGNAVGIDPSGTIAMPNGGAAGIDVDGASATIGGVDPGHANIISANTGDGIATSFTDTTILSNRIWGNGQLGIDIGDDGVTTNSGADLVLDHPELASPTASGGILTVTYTFDGPAGDYRIEFFVNPSGADGSGYGEGETLVHARSLTAHPGGAASYTAVFAGSAGDVVTATATEDTGGGSFGDSSEFSRWTTAVAPSALLIGDDSVRRSDVTSAGGAPTIVTGAAGDAFDLDGVDDRLVGPGLDVTDSALTMRGRVRLDTSVGTQSLVTKRSAVGQTLYELAVDGGTGEAVATIRLSGAPITAQGGSITTGMWHQLDASWDGADLVLYVDGLEVDRTAAVGVLDTDPTTDVTIGARDDGTQRIDGRIDEVSVGHVPLTADAVAVRHANVQTPTVLVSIGDEQTGVPGAWTVDTAQSRSGSYSLLAPETVDAGSAAWAVATGIDEPGVVFESWWWLTTDTGIDVAAGTRAGPVPIDQFSGAGTGAPFTWELRHPTGSGDVVDASAPDTATTGAWVKVEMWTDQLDNSRLVVDGTEVIGWTTQGVGPTSGSVGLAVDELPVGQEWRIDDPRARRLVTPEPVASLRPLDRG